MAERKDIKDTAEFKRLKLHRERKANWRNWGPYLSERAWGTVREDYSADGSAWQYLSHEDARSTVYRWNEDGMAGLCDRHQFLCFSLALWNGIDPILKERFFGLTGPQGNHGEDVKEYYFYLDNTPTHSYMKMLYKYPQAPFPYEELVRVNGERGPDDYEYELLDTGVFDDDRYFDIEVQYAKAGENDLLLTFEATNHGPEEAPLYLLPTLWFRNTWSWGYPNGPMGDSPGKPKIELKKPNKNVESVSARHATLGTYYLYAEGAEEFLFTDNETGKKDAFHRVLVDGEQRSQSKTGTKTCAVYRTNLKPGGHFKIRLRLVLGRISNPFDNFEKTFRKRRAEANDFYASVQSEKLQPDEKRVQRQALAGMLWSKQLYYYDVKQWLEGDHIRPPVERWEGRNHDWGHLSNFDVMSMPDKWEYPWYASWDLAFHCVAIALVDSDFAKRQLELLTREWYMHPNGQLPAYEWDFSDVNPPVHAWAVWRVYKIEERNLGRADRVFLEEMFHKLLFNFTWWVNRKDEEDRNVFQGGFLGLDNISIFDRSARMPGGGRLDQADGTAWMGAYCLTLLQISLELAKANPVYEQSASMFFEHFLRIADAVNRSTTSLWDEQDGFYYDKLVLPGQDPVPIKVRSLVGLLALGVVETLEEQDLKRFPVFARRMKWFTKNRPQISKQMACMETKGEEGRRLLAFLTPARLRSLLQYLLDEGEFLSDYGIRSVSRYHRDNPFTAIIDGKAYSIHYEPGESSSRLYGGNSNWCGPIWFPINFLLIEAIQRFHYYYGDTYKVEFPTGSGESLNLAEVADHLSRRLSSIFLRGTNGERPVYGGMETFQNDPEWRDYLLFYEYFHGDNGAGLGASHQTGWTGLVAKLLQQSGGKPAVSSERRSLHKLNRLHHPKNQKNTRLGSIEEDLLNILLKKGKAAFHHEIQAKWPLNAEDAFGVIPTPLRLRADPRFTGRGITMAFIDSGFYPHPDLVQPHNRIKAWVDATETDATTIRFGPEDKVEWPGWNDESSGKWHGLMTTVAATGNGYLSEGLYRGLASSAELVLVKVMEPSHNIPDADILRALAWIKKHKDEFQIRVVNISVGGEPAGGRAESPIDLAVEDLVASGITVVVAAGNDGTRFLNPPATCPSALTIGGIDDHNTFDPRDLELWHSNYGEGFGEVAKPELVAPSLWIVAPVLPRSGVAREAKEIFASSVMDLDRVKELKLVTQHYQHVDGTSFAAPITASAVACLLEACPKIQPPTVREALTRTAKFVDGADKERQGAGALQPSLAIGWAQRHQHGHLEDYPHLPQVSESEVIFLLHDHNATCVELCGSGSWSRWQKRLPFKRLGDGVWEFRLPRPKPGQYRYKFIIDHKTWIDDPANPSKEPDGAGGFNSLLRIEEQ